LQNTAGQIHSYTIPRLVKTGVLLMHSRDQEMVSFQPAELHLFTSIFTMGDIVTDMVAGREGGMKRPSQANLPSFGYIFVME